VALKDQIGTGGLGGKGIKKAGVSSPP